MVPARRDLAAAPPASASSAPRPSRTASRSRPRSGMPACCRAGLPAWRRPCVASGRPRYQLQRRVVECRVRDRQASRSAATTAARSRASRDAAPRRAPVPPARRPRGSARPTTSPGSRSPGSPTARISGTGHGQGGATYGSQRCSFSIVDVPPGWRGTPHQQVVAETEQRVGRAGRREPAQRQPVVRRRQGREQARDEALVDRRARRRASAGHGHHLSAPPAVAVERISRW